MACNCPPDEAKCPNCPLTPTCKHWQPSRNSKFYNCSDRNQYGLCKRPKTDCPNCPLYSPPGFVGRPRVVDEFDRMEVDDPTWNDPRSWGDEIDPQRSHAEAQERYRQRLDEPSKNSPEYMRDYMRKYRARKKGGKPNEGDNP